MPFDTQPSAGGPAPAAPRADFDAAEIGAAMAGDLPGRPPSAALALLHSVQVDGDFDRGLDPAAFEPCVVTVMLRPIGHR